MDALYVVDGSQNVEQLAYNYFRVRIWAAPATLALYSIKGWFIGMQNARIPMFIAIVMNVLNIGFSLFFVFIFHWDIEGVALGTVFAQYGGLGLAIVLWMAYYRRFICYFNLKESLRLSEMKQFFKVNLDIFVRTLCLV